MGLEIGALRRWCAHEAMASSDDCDAGLYCDLDLDTDLCTAYDPDAAATCVTPD